MSWVQLIRPVGAKKLAWIREALDQAKLRYRIQGETFDRIEVEVQEDQAQEANRILLPINELDDSDPMFTTRPGTANPAWWREAPSSFGELAGALGILANKVLKGLVGDRDLGELDESTKEAIEPLVRTQNLLLGICEVLDGEDDGALAWANNLIDVQDLTDPEGDQVYWLTFFHVLGEWQSENTLHRLVGVRAMGPGAVVDAVINDTKEIDGVVYPRVIHAVRPDDPGNN